MGKEEVLIVNPDNTTNKFIWDGRSSYAWQDEEGVEYTLPVNTYAISNDGDIGAYHVACQDGMTESSIERLIRHSGIMPYAKP